MALVLPVLIQPNQGAFVRGRSITHNIMIFQDPIKNYGRAVTSPRCAIKIDLSKAYDTVDWQFLEDLLRAFCFPMKFIGWIMTCVRNTSYSLLMNGRVQGSFKGKMGLHQGDPMSPLLFGSLSAVSIFKEALGKFSEVTGLSINTNKSHIYFGGVNAAERRVIAQEIQLPEGSFPLRYLGVPMRPTKWKHEDCEIIVHKIRLKLLSRTCRHLSYAGRMLLIHFVLFGLRNYWMSVFILPQSIVKEVEKLCRMFLWGASGNRSKLHLASWHQVCLPKAYGALGFRDGANWNRAILAKYI
ncbi:uncharacterized protein LOC133825462 [Humulus lupulus]|uniref:uncharacterized protein LOC133825462 n=1 Tax=Humulus lupulus TaxID=3486 RepID=UPI002B417C3A|nr:uncharacterized protein LOC133825462 [Humulus lupulus]